MTVTDLADATGTEPRMLFRLLRALASCGVFEQHDDGRFALNALAEPLRPEAAGGSAYRYALYVGQPLVQRPWEQLVSTLRTGRPAFEHVFEAPMFEYLASNPGANDLFNDAMSSNTSRDADAVVGACEFGDDETIVDVAGGHGALLAAILAAAPEAGGVLFDLPHVLAGARETLRSRGVADRCRLVEGDMFESVPSGADTYILKRTLHDWEDDRAAVILANCARAMRDGGRVLVIDMIIPPGADGRLAKLYDLMMMVMLGGRERTEAEFDDLFAAAGLTRTRTIPTTCPLSIVEGVRA
jgi:ubiquinone/menaquinone biosynthesis C-methylase UbiE